MIFILLIVVPCAMFAVALVAVLDRVGVLPRLGGGGPGSGSWELREGPPRAALIAMLALMGAWVLAWIVVLFLGFGILSA